MIQESKNPVVLRFNFYRSVRISVSCTQEAGGEGERS
jgi:hypothetical protein